MTMPMLDIQRRHAEVFRIRLGEKGSRGEPKKLTDAIRITSPNRSVVNAFTEVFGGDAREWENQWEAYLPTTELPIMVLPGQSISQWWELYRKSVCERRCDGVTETLSGNACMCPADITDRLQTKGACRPMTRVNVVCPDVAVVGAGSLVTHGMVAAETLPQSIQVAEAALARGLMVPAVLRIVEHKGKTHYIVPQIEIVGISLHELTTGEVPQHPRQVVSAPQRSLPPMRPPHGSPVADTKELPAAPAPKAAPRPRPPLPNEVDPAEAAAARDVETRKSRLHSIVGRVAEDKRGLLAKDWKKAGLPERDKFAALTPKQLPDAEALIHQWIALSVLAAIDVTSEKDRHAIVKAATDGATESTKNLTAEQLDALIAYCEPQQPTLGGDAA